MNYFTPNKNFIRKNFSTELNCNPNIILWFEIDTKTLNEHEKEEKSKQKIKEKCAIHIPLYHIVLTALTIIQSKKIGK